MSAWALLLKGRIEGGDDSTIQNVVALHREADDAVTKLKEVARGNNLRIREDGLSTSCLAGNVYFYAIERWEVN